jgi:hypothetical protein
LKLAKTAKPGRNTDKKSDIMPIKTQTSTHHETITFDTLDFANRLKSVGFTDEQAQVITELQRTTTGNTLEQARYDYHLDDVATKRDLKEMETALRHEVELLRADTGRLIAESKADGLLARAFCKQRWLLAYW